MRAAVKWAAHAGLPVLVLACFGSSAGPPAPDAAMETDDGGALDATTPPGPDGSAPEAAPAGDSSAPDVYADTYVAEAAPPEASVMASPTMVTVVVRSALGPEQGVTVVFDDASGNVLATATTDALGGAAQTVPAGSQVTVVMGTYLAPQLATIQSVAPGDLLAFYDASYDPQTPSVVVALAPDAGPPPGTASMQAFIGHCTSYQGVPGTVVLGDPDCMWQGQFPVLVLATGGEDAGEAVLGYTFQKNNPIFDDAGGIASVTLPGPWYTTIGSETVDVVDGGAGYAAVSLSQVASNVSTSSTQYGGSGATFSDIFPTYPAFDDDLQAEVNLSQGGEYESITGLARRGLGDGGTTTFDLGQALPFITSASVDTSTPSQPTVNWQTSIASFGAADGVITYVNWSDSIGNQSVSGAWTIVAPATASSVTAPALSPAAQLWAPATTANYSTPVVAVVDADFVTSYAELRAMATFLPLTTNLLSGNSGNSANDAPTLPVDGTLRFTAITVNGD
jgi:hypothetical protein